MDQYIGRLLDNRYEILENIGTGGMAVVYKARCHRLNRLVAIKILKDEYFRDEEFRRRFQHEGEAVAMLSHPNIVQVYDVSSTDTADFIVMELIDGITLKQYMENRGTLNWKETLHFAMQIAKALEHAHERSIVHRDIKPHNVMVLKNGSVKVTDFGIARVMSKSNTLTKEALGSVHYISPEQAKGGWVDNRSDLYSLSVVMYEMMTGRPPYDGESPVAVAIQHINGGAPMPSTLNPNIPGGLEQIIMKGMALDAKDRYSSATEMLADMEEFRKDPTILFEGPKQVPSEPTQVLNTAAVAEAIRQQPPKTTAERVAGNTAGAAAAAKARAAAEQRRAASPEPVRREPPDMPRPRTGTGMPRTNSQPQPRPRPRPESSASRTRQNSSGQSLPRRTREEIREEIREEERNRMATIAVVVCSAVAVVAIVIFLLLVVNGEVFNKNGTPVTVPSFVGKDYDTIGEVYGLEIVVGAYEYDDQVAKGQVIYQQPDAGNSVVSGTKVTLTVSLGAEPEQPILENLTGTQADEAKAYITAIGAAALTKTEFSDTIQEGYVTRTDPAEGTPISEGQIVYVYVSLGPAIEIGTVPKVVGLSYSTAYNQLVSLGFTNVTFDYEEDDAEKDRVIAQSVERGTELDLTAQIVLTISKGPKETKPTEAPTEKPTEKPTEAPTEPEEKEVTKTVELDLPDNLAEGSSLSIFRNGTAVLEGMMLAGGIKTVDVTLRGSGTEYFDVYINGNYYETIKVVFS